MVNMSERMCVAPIDVIAKAVQIVLVILKTANVKGTGEREHPAGAISRETDRITFSSKTSPSKVSLSLKVIFKSL